MWHLVKENLRYQRTFILGFLTPALLLMLASIIYLATRETVSTELFHSHLIWIIMLTSFPIDTAATKLFNPTKSYTCALLPLSRRRISLSYTITAIISSIPTLFYISILSSLNIIQLFYVDTLLFAYSFLFIEFSLSVIILSIRPYKLSRVFIVSIAFFTAFAYFFDTVPNFIILPVDGKWELITQQVSIDGFSSGLTGILFTGLLIITTITTYLIPALRTDFIPINATNGMDFNFNFPSSNNTKLNNGTKHHSFIFTKVFLSYNKIIILFILLCTLFPFGLTFLDDNFVVEDLRIAITFFPLFFGSMSFIMTALFLNDFFAIQDPKNVLLTLPAPRKAMIIDHTVAMTLTIGIFSIPWIALIVRMNILFPEISYSYVFLYTLLVILYGLSILIFPAIIRNSQFSLQQRITFGTCSLLLTLCFAAALVFVNPFAPCPSIAPLAAFIATTGYIKLYKKLTRLHLDHITTLPRSLALASGGHA